MGYPLKQSQTAQALLFMMFDSSDHTTPKTGLTPTVTLSKNGGAFASPSGAVTEIGNGLYRVAGNATDSNTLGPLTLYATATGADPVLDVFVVVAYDPQAAAGLGLTNLDATVSSRMATYTQPTGFLSTAFPSGTVASTTNITAGTITTATNLTTNNDKTGYTVSTVSDKTGYSLSSGGIQAIWDAASSALTTVGSIGKRLVDYLTGDIFARIGAPVGDSISADIAAVQSDTDNIQTRLPTSLVSGRIDASVGAMTTDSLSAAAVSSGAVTKIAAGVASQSAALLKYGPFKLVADGLNKDGVLVLRRGDIKGVRAQLVDDTGKFIDITGATMTASMQDTTGTAISTTNTVTNINASEGYIEVSIDTTDTDLLGVKRCTLIVTRTANASDVSIFPLSVVIEG